jgi:hypothetical protein
MIGGLDSRSLLASQQISLTEITSHSSYDNADGDQITKTPKTGMSLPSGNTLGNVTPSMTNRLASRQPTTAEYAATNRTNHNTNSASNRRIQQLDNEEQDFHNTPTSVPVAPPRSGTSAPLRRTRTAPTHETEQAPTRQPSTRASCKLQTDDTLRRLSKVIHRHITVCKRRTVAASVPAASNPTNDAFDFGDRLRTVAHTGFRSRTVPQPAGPTPLLLEADFVKPRWRYRFHRGTGLNMMSQYTLEKVEHENVSPSETDIYDFFKVVFSHASLSGECGVVCLIYIERLMEVAGLMLLPSNWRPVVLVALLLASKVWQDMSSWNVEFACAFPQYSLKSINRMERLFVEYLKWDLYVSGPLYAKYHYALTNIAHRKNDRARGRYNLAVGIPMRKPLTATSATAAVIQSRSLGMHNSLQAGSCPSEQELDDAVTSSSAGASVMEVHFS